CAQSTAIARPAASRDDEDGGSPKIRNRSGRPERPNWATDSISRGVMSGSLRRATAFRAFQACRSLRPPPSRTTPPSTTSTVVRGSLSQFRLSARAFRRERKRPFLDPGTSPLSESLSERPVSPSPTPLVLLPGCMLLGAPECEGLTKSRRKASGLQQWGYK